MTTEKSKSGLAKIFWNLFLITIGSIICAVAVNSILVPKKFLAGGFTGLAMLIHYLTYIQPITFQLVMKGFAGHTQAAGGFRLVALGGL